jgi:hypothetical protein
MKDHAQIAELLPWLLNGTLSTAEQAEVRAHLAACATCRAERGETVFAYRANAAHVPAAVLADYAFERPLVGFDPDLLRQHLATCRECAEQLELARASHQWAQADEELQPQLVFTPAERPRLRFWQWVTAMACLFAMLGLGGWWLNWRQAVAEQQRWLAERHAANDRLAQLQTENEQLRQRATPPDLSGEVARLQEKLKELSAPQANVLTQDIFPQDYLRRSEQTALNDIRVPRGAQTVSLILNSRHAHDATNLSLEIARANGAVVWRTPNLRRHTTGDYTLSLPADFLPSGRYAVNIYGMKEGRRQKLESYEIRLRK